MAEMKGRKTKTNTLTLPNSSKLLRETGETKVQEIQQYLDQLKNKRLPNIRDIYDQIDRRLKDIVGVLRSM